MNYRLLSHVAAGFNQSAYPSCAKTASFTTCGFGGVQAFKTQQNSPDTNGVLDVVSEHEG